MKSKYMALGAVLGLGVALVGCSNPTQITTRDGQSIVIPDEPEAKKNDDFITYSKDGKEVRMHKDEVSKIEEVN